MASKYYDRTAVIQVIGDVLVNPIFLDDTDKYIITPEDFADDLHRVAFGAIYDLYNQGVSQISINNICDYLSTKPKSQAIFETNKGEEWLKNVIKNAMPSAFDFYYNRMKKMSLLRAYDAYGVDVRFIYDPDTIDTKQQQLQDEKLENMSLVDIADKVDKIIEEIRNSYTGNEFINEHQAGDGIDELINNLMMYPEVGMPLYGKFINRVTRGARLKKLYLRSAATGLGKAIPNDTLIPTPQGWKKVGDIHVGDYLFGQNGKPTKVLHVYPQPTSKNIWEVEFSDGRIAKCCEDHLWEYRYESHRGFAYRVESIKEIYERTKKLKNGLKDSCNRGFRFHIKLNEPLQYQELKLPIDPYVMGLILGDGSFRYSSSNKSFSFSSNDEELPSNIANIMGWNYKKSSEHNYNYSFEDPNSYHVNVWVEELLKEYPDLWQAKSEDKFIPQEYMLSSIDQRWSLLQGLMDTDGSIDQEKGRTTFTTISPKLRDDLINLCHSLGLITSYSVDKRPEKYTTTGECYNIHIQCKKELKPQLFRLKRKVQIAINYANLARRSEYKDHLAIVDIRPTENKANMTCFTVDNEDHLFLMNDYIVTHNTRSMVADCCYIGCDMIYDDMLGWIGNGTAEPSMFIATEQDLSEVQTMMLAFLSSVNEEHILSNKYEGDELERVRKAAEILKRSPIYVEEIPDFSVQDIENIIKKNIREHDIKYCFFDYIHTSMKILEEVTRRSGGVKLREDNVLFILATKLKDICNKYGVFILTSTQLNASYQDSETPDQNLLRGAKSIADRIDYGSILLSVTSQDLESLQSLLQSQAFEQPNLKLSIYKNRRGQYKGIYLWCKADLGTCRIQPMFATDWRYQLIEMDDFEIKVEPGAFQ